MNMDDTKKLAFDLVHLSRLALTSSRADVEMFVRRVARRLERVDAKAHAELLAVISALPRRTDPLRFLNSTSIPIDRDSKLSLLKNEDISNIDKLILDEVTEEQISEIILERKRTRELLSCGLEPSKTLLFTGPPGVGKTLSAKFIARELQLPLLTLDLSAVMSSFLGRTGSNIRSVFEFAKNEECILFLDELDSVAKKRDDSGEVGELKRLVTVLLQEMDNWPSSSLLIAATNHQELLDPAIWRRFDKLVKFSIPKGKSIGGLVDSIFASSAIEPEFQKILGIVFHGQPHAEILRDLKQIKRSSILKDISLNGSIETFLHGKMVNLSYEERLKIAEALLAAGTSQRKAKEITGISRDTMRKKLSFHEEET